MSINITDIHFVGTWKYTCQNTECVCKVSIYMPTNTQINDRNIYRDNVTISTCNHGFHNECYKSLSHCPFDNTELVHENKEKVYIVG